MDSMELARFNIYWFLWLLAPAVIMIASTYWRRISVLVLGIALSLVSTYLLSNMAVAEKWRIRNEVAATEEQLSTATSDGANIVFTRFLFAPVEAVVFTAFWGIIGWRCSSVGRSTPNAAPNPLVSRDRNPRERGFRPVNSDR